MERETEVAVRVMLDGRIVRCVGGGEKLGPDPEAVTAVGLPDPERGLDGIVGKLAEMVLPTGPAIEEDAGAHRGGDDEVDGSVGDFDAAGQIHVRQLIDCHADAPRFQTNEMRRKTKEHCMRSGESGCGFCPGISWSQTD